MNKQSLLYKFFKFLRRPEYEIHSKSGHFQKLTTNLRLFSILYFFVILLGFTINIALSLVNFQDQDHAVVDFVSTASPMVVIIVSAILAPLMEEITFRLGLKFSLRRLALSLSFGVVMLAGMIFTSFIAEIGVLLGAYVILFFVIYQILKYISAVTIDNIYKKHFGLLFYFSAVTFGLIHIQNYTDLSKSWFLLPLLILPQLLAGLIFGYVRVKLGFTYALFTHIFYNSLTLFPVLLFSSVGFIEGIQFEELDLTQQLILTSGFLAGCIFALFILLANLYSLIELFRKPKNTL